MQNVPLGVTCSLVRAEGLDTGMASQRERVHGGKTQEILVVTMFRGWGEEQEPNGGRKTRVIREECQASSPRQDKEKGACKPTWGCSG